MVPSNMGSTQGSEGLSILNPSPRTLPGPNLLHQLIERHHGRDEPAIDFLDRSGERSRVSYAELNLLSDRLANRISRELDALPARDSEKGAVVPLLIPQSLDLYVAILAILKSGAAYCPLNLDTPTERIKFILQDTQAGLVLSTSSFSHSLREADPDLRILVVDEKDSPGVGGVTECQPETKSDPSDLAYIMYTSGSTGTPKGVGVSHTAATQSLLAHDRHIPSFSRFLQFAAPTFDVSVFEIFFPLFRGSTLVCCDRTRMLADLSGIIQRLEVDACELTPSVTASLLKSRDSVPGLKLLLTIGEMLTEPVVAEFGGDSNAPGLLWGMYGPTEAAIHWYE
jgi:ferricrocin synthase